MDRVGKKMPQILPDLNKLLIRISLVFNIAFQFQKVKFSLLSRYLKYNIKFIQNEQLSKHHYFTFFKNTNSYLFFLGLEISSFGSTEPVTFSYRSVKIRCSHVSHLNLIGFDIIQIKLFGI